MVESMMSEIYSPATIQAFKEKSTNKQQVNYPKHDDLTSILAPKFKHQTIASSQDICEIRKLLTIERSSMNEEEHKFWSSDYERMMQDDWLVTRFILRGQKASLKLGISSSQSSIYIQTMNLIRMCAKFRHEYQINANTRECEFPIEWTKRNGIFNYKPDLAGNPVIYLRIRLHKPKLIETKELRYQFKRILLYYLEKCDQDLTNNLGKGICCIFDMSNATFENVDLEMLSWMIKSFKSCSPKLICYVIVYNLPWFFSATLKLIAKTLMSNSNKQCLKFVYGDEILNFISPNNLPTYVRDNLCIK